MEPEKPVTPHALFEPADHSRLVQQVFPAGRIIADKYEVLALIGSGGMGNVYRVKQVFLGKEFALKVLSAEFSNESTIRRFQLEAVTTAQLQHPNLVEVHDFGLINEHEPYLVMDLIDGITLSRHLKTRGSLPVAEAIPIIIQACFGLAYAHERRVVHRDIKPGNILLAKPEARSTATDIVKVVDFGIAKLMQHEDGEIQSLTRTGEIFGSPTYMSPEQCKGAPVDHRSDIYSMGCVLFEILTGSPPFIGETALSTMMKRLSEPAPSLKEGSLGQDFSRRLERIVAKMLAVDPNDRQQSVNEVIKELMRLDHDEPTSGKSGSISMPKLKVKAAPNHIPLMIGIAVIACCVTEAFDQWRYSTTPVSQAAKVAPKLREDLDLDNIPRPAQLQHPTAELLKDAQGRYFRRFKFGKECIGTIKVGERKWDAIGDVDIAGTTRAELTITNKDAQIDTKLLADLDPDSICSIEISKNQLLGSGASSELYRFRNLEEVDLSRTMVTNIDCIVGLPKLKILCISETGVTAKDILKVERLNELTRFQFGPIDNPSAVLKHIEHSTALEDLDVRAISNADCDLISHIPNLRKLALREGQQVTEAAVRKILKAEPNLQYIQLFDCDITGNILPVLKACKKLEGVRITSNGWTQEQMDEANRTPNIRFWFETPGSIKAQKRSEETRQILNVVK